MHRIVLLTYITNLPLVKNSGTNWITCSPTISHGCAKNTPTFHPNSDLWKDGAPKPHLEPPQLKASSARPHFAHPILFGYIRAPLILLDIPNMITLRNTLVISSHLTGPVESKNCCKAWSLKFGINVFGALFFLVLVTWIWIFVYWSTSSTLMVWASISDPRV